MQQCTCTSYFRTNLCDDSISIKLFSLLFKILKLFGLIFRILTILKLIIGIEITCQAIIIVKMFNFLIFH